MRISKNRNRNNTYFVDTFHSDGTLDRTMRFSTEEEASGAAELYVSEHPERSADLYKATSVHISNNSVNWDLLATEINTLLSYARGSVPASQVRFSDEAVQREFSKVVRQRLSRDRVVKSLFAEA